MKKEELISVFMEFVGENFPELIEEEKGDFNNGDTYYTLDSNGDTLTTAWFNSESDEQRLSIGNAFKTEKEAEFMVEKLKVLHELQELGRPYRLGAENYFINLYKGVALTIGVDYSYQRFYFGSYFDTNVEVQQAIEKIGEDRIKKYLFGVEG